MLYNYNYYSYTLLDWTIIDISETRFECPEILFNPHIYPQINSKNSIANSLNDEIKKCAKDIQN